MSDNVSKFPDKHWMELSTEQYEEAGRLDVNIKLHIKVKPHGTNICAYGTNRFIICMAETPSDFEYIVEEFVKAKMEEINLHMEKMVVV
jgi:hypothetical protein